MNITNEIYIHGRLRFEIWLRNAPPPFSRTGR
jgi:hypothetical protein